MSPRSCCILLFTLQKTCYTRSVCLSPRSCCILLFTLQKACYTRSVCLSPAKRLFIVVNVVFVVFHPQQAHRERARWQGSFRSCGEVPLVGAVGGWPVGSPWARPPPLRRAGGRVSGFQRGREACRPAPWGLIAQRAAALVAAATLVSAARGVRLEGGREGEVGGEL